MRRTPMPGSSKPLTRKAPLRQVSEKKAAEGGSRFSTLDRKSLESRTTPMKRARWTPAVPKDTRAALIERSAGGWCEIQMTGCLGQGTDPSHRITTKNGGRHGAAKVEHDRLSDVLWACRRCHDWLGDHPAAAKAERVGWALEEWQNPTECPVLYRGRLVFLDDFGGVHDYEAGVA